MGPALSTAYGLLFRSRSELRLRGGTRIVGGYDQSHMIELPNNSAGTSANWQIPCALPMLVEDVILSFQTEHDIIFFPDSGACPHIHTFK